MGYWFGGSLWIHSELIGRCYQGKNWILAFFVSLPAVKHGLCREMILRFLSYVEAVSRVCGVVTAAEHQLHVTLLSTRCQ